MKNFFLFLIVAAGAGVGWFLLKKHRERHPNAGSLQANKPAPAIAGTDDWMKDKPVIYGIVSAIPTVLKGLAPGRWFNPDDTRQIYEENERGGNVSDNLEDLEAYDQGFAN